MMNSIYEKNPLDYPWFMVKPQMTYIRMTYKYIRVI